ncbi:MAG: hypothetical protein EOO20_18945 [Chryseobacterium sp.]|nr:MAG: hypothetical protein EOO20_18945 [Chryseobacterium sp.]
MIRNIFALTLLIISVSLSFKHCWDMLNYKSNPNLLNMIKSLGIAETVVPFFSILAIATGFLLLIPGTFFWGNVLNASIVVLIMALAIRSGNNKMVLIEIPFLILPLLLIWLKYPFKN